MQALDQKITSQAFYKIFALLDQKKFDEAEKILKSELAQAEKETDPVTQAVYYSTYGVLCKLKKDYRKAWKYYEQAEKKLPEDPSLKIITARLLVEYFAQYDTVIKKMDKVLKLAASNFSYLHHAYTLKGMALFKSGKKKEAAEALRQSMGAKNKFEGLETATNFDFQLVQEFLERGLERELCAEYLNAALVFAQNKKEPVFEKMIQYLLSKFLNQNQP